MHKVGNPFAVQKQLYPAKPRPAPAPRALPADLTSGQRAAALERQTEARSRLQFHMRRGAYLHEFD